MERALHEARIPFKENEFVAAVDGSLIDRARLAQSGLISPLGLARLNSASPIWGMDLTLGAVGCALSHINIWAEVAARQLQCALVLEDDCLFRHGSGDGVPFADEYMRRMAYVPDDWEVVYLSGLDTQHQGHLLDLGNGVRRVHQFHRTTNAYVVSAEGARSLLKHCCPITFQLDTMMTMHCARDTRTQAMYVVAPVSYTLHPPLIVQATRWGSDIQLPSQSDELRHSEEQARIDDAGWSRDK